MQAWLGRDCEPFTVHTRWMADTTYSSALIQGSLVAIVVPLPLQPEAPLQIGIGRLASDLVCPALQQGPFLEQDVQGVKLSS